MSFGVGIIALDQHADRAIAGSRDVGCRRGNLWFSACMTEQVFYATELHQTFQRFDCGEHQINFAAFEELKRIARTYPEMCDSF